MLDKSNKLSLLTSHMCLHFDAVTAKVSYGLVIYLPMTRRYWDWRHTAFRVFSLSSHLEMEKVGRDKDINQWL